MIELITPPLFSFRHAIFRHDCRRQHCRLTPHFMMPPSLHMTGRRGFAKPCFRAMPLRRRRLFRAMPCRFLSRFHAILALPAEAPFFATPLLPPLTPMPPLIFHVFFDAAIAEPLMPPFAALPPTSPLTPSARATDSHIRHFRLSFAPPVFSMGIAAITLDTPLVIRR